MKNMSAALVHNDLFALLLTAFLRTENKTFLIVTLKNVQLSLPVLSVIEKSGGRWVKLDELGLEISNGLRHIWVHNFGLKEKAQAIISEFNLEYSIYSDGLKNEIGKDAVEKFFPNYSSILCFGFFWDKPFLKKSSQLKVCTFKNIIDIFSELKLESQAVYNFSEGDLKKDWMFLRYWGQGPGEFKATLNYSTVIEKYLIEKNSSDLLIKGDSRVKSISTQNLIANLQKKMEVSALENKVSFNNENIIDKDKFFAETMIPSTFKGNFHGFNSSLSIYVAIVTSAKVHFPSKEFISDTFKNTAFKNGVINYNALYDAICQKISCLKESNYFDSNKFFIVHRRKDNFEISELKSFQKEQCIRLNSLTNL
ncbi:hypothetical protein [uncultured Psychromonas sp.]|uniref:hypothetical protein n=1 Tax=uncultured Psychromonas sp. TaxID=173974 RepID=UPI00263754F4|nr:hypothetical protein [uncultured Psychromonas sp.]